MKTHVLKTIQPFFDDIWNGKKTFEVRKNDRDFKCGDLLQLREYDDVLQKYLPREIIVEITFILSDERYCKKGFVIMQFKDLFYRGL